MALMQHQVVHIHPTLLCNLACAHCYSTSGPDQASGLDPNLILNATRQLRAYGMVTASLSGGEPTIYAGLDPLCEGLSAQGYRISVITNGMLPDRALDLSQRHNPATIAVSFDGLRPRHDLIRRRKGAFDRASETLRLLAQSRQRCGAIISFAEDSVEDLPDVLAHVVALGAHVVQLHPVAEVGRGSACALVKAPSPQTILKVLVLTRLFQAAYPDVSLSCDALTGQDLKERCAPQAGQTISPVVIGADGVVCPISHTLADRFAFGRIGGALQAPVFCETLARVAADVMQAESRKPATAFYEAFEHAAVAAGEAV